MIKRTWTLWVTLTVLAGAGSIDVQAQNIDLNVKWESSRHLEDGRIYLPKELSYLIFVQRGDESEQYLDTVQDTFYTFSAELGVVQRLRVMAVDDYGRESEKSEWSDPIFFEENETPSLQPVAAELRPNYPNPFNPQTSIVYGVPLDVSSGDRVQLDIYTVDGKLVRSLEVDRSPGWHEVLWDGTDDSGGSTAAGMYMTRFVVGAMVETGKMTMLK